MDNIFDYLLSKIQEGKESFHIEETNTGNIRIYPCPNEGDWMEFEE